MSDSTTINTWGLLRTETLRAMCKDLGLQSAAVKRQELVDRVKTVVGHGGPAVSSPIAKALRPHDRLARSVPGELVLGFHGRQ